MPKPKDRPEKSNGGGGGGYDPYTHQQPHQQPPPPQPPPMNPQVGIMPAADVPQGHPPGFSAAPGRYVNGHGGRGSWQAPGFPPPPAGHVATGAFNLQPPLPIGEKATHFSGPIVSGGIPQVTSWTPPHGGPMLTDPIGGSANLTSVLSLDYSQGNFTIPLQFPPDSLVVSIGTATAVAFTAPPSFQLGTTYGGAEVGGGSMPAPGGPLAFTPAFGQLPLWDAAPPQVPFLAYLTVSGNTGGTAGLGFILVQFLRIPQRWT